MSDKPAVETAQYRFGSISVSSEDTLTVRIVYDFNNLRSLGEACIWSSADYLEIIDEVAKVRELPDEYGSSITFKTNRNMIAFLKDLIARLNGVMSDENMKPLLTAR